MQHRTEAPSRPRGSENAASSAHGGRETPPQSLIDELEDAIAKNDLR